MNKEDKKLQKHLVDEMMKTYKTNPDVMYYMEALMKYCIKIEQENARLNNIINELENWLNIQQNISSPEQIINDIFNKLKELKEKSDKK